MVISTAMLIWHGMTWIPHYAASSSPSQHPPNLSTIRRCRVHLIGALIPDFCVISNENFYSLQHYLMGGPGLRTLIKMLHYCPQNITMKHLENCRSPISWKENLIIKEWKLYFTDVLNVYTINQFILPFCQTTDKETSYTY
jgi:hypothetical protein